MSAAAVREVDPAAALLDRARGAEREAACEALPSEALVALAGGPRWTPDALALVGLDREVVAGRAAVLVRREGRGDDLVLSIDPGALPAVNAELARRRVDVVALARQVGQRLAAATDLEVPPVLALWIELAAGLTQGAHALADKLRDDVREACRAGRPAQASKRLEAASALERVIGGPLAVAVRLGRHRVEHTQRVARDGRQLAAFVPRVDAQGALVRLHARTGPWALHYLGVGGVGKTSFLRHLEIVDATDPEVLGRLEVVADTMRARREGGDERPVALTVARIDFDYLSPSYPGADPGRLVEAIVHELTARIEHAVQDRWLQSIAEHLDVVRAYAAEAPGHDPLAPFGWEAFQRLLGFVGSLLASFEHPVLIFDTCEELMKLAPVGGKVPSVEATFRLIEELHERCAALRVIFAGRRLLAERGAGWEAPPLPVARVLTAPRAYLALHELRGFDGGEAAAALARLLPEGRRADRALIDAILAASPEDERATDVERPGAGGEDGVAEAPRYSPFRVAAYGAWVAAEPGLELAALTRGGADPYIEHRIVRRMGEPLEGLLPVVALLRRFDTATLAAVLPEPDDAPALMEGLAGHEWIDVDHDSERGVLLTAKRSVARPLARYLAAARVGAWDRAQRQVAAGLGPRLEAAGMAGVPQEVVDATLRSLAGDAAVRVWQGLEERIGAGWSSALKLTRFLMGEDAAAEDATTLLGAAVRATHASALIHVEPGAELARLWQEVEATAAAHLHLVGDRPTEDLAGGRAARHDGGPPRAWLLMHRARLGLAATQAWSSDGELGDQVGAITDVLDELARWKRLDALACPVIAAVEAVVERAERMLDWNDIGHVIDQDGLAVLESSLSALTRTTPGLTAFALILRARIHAVGGEIRLGQELHVEALQASDVGPRCELPSTVLDWAPPTSLRARIRTEALRLGFFDPVEAARESAWLNSTSENAVDKDSGHLQCAASLYAEARRRARIVPLPRIPAVRTLPYACHGRFAIQEYAELLHRDGRLAAAERGHVPLLANHALTYERARFAMCLDASVSTADVAIESGIGWIELMTAKVAALTQLDVGDRSLRLLSRVSFDVSAVWSAQVANTHVQREALVNSMRGRVPELVKRSSAGVLLDRMRVATVLDEVVELSRYTTEPIAVELPEVSTLTYAQVHPDQVEDVARLMLRAWAANRLVYPPRAAQPSSAATWLWDVARAAPRRFAQLAHDLGQHLSLRLPERAVRLLDLAAATYEECEDRVGAAAARLAGDVARHRAGQPPIVDTEATLAALEPADRELLAPLARRLAAARDKAGAVDPFLARFERGERRRPARPKRLRSWWQRNRSEVGSWAGVAGVLAVFAAVVVAFNFWALPRLAAWISPEQLPVGDNAAFIQSAFGSKLVANLLVIGVLYGLFHLGGVRAWFRARRRDAKVRALVLAGQLRRAGEHEVVSTLTTADGQAIDLRARIPKAGRHPELLGARTPDGVPLALAPLIGRLGSFLPPAGALPLSLVVNPTVAGPSWETALLESHPLLFRTLVPRRMVPVPRPPARGRGDGAFRASVALRSLLGEGLAGPGVVHAIGRPVRDAYAIGLDLGDEGVAGGDAGGGRLSPGALASADTTLVVLQGAPQAAAEVPTDAFRSEVALLRELGMALIAQGVAEVLIIPPLPEATMRSLQAALAKPLTLDPALPARRDHLAHAHTAREHLIAIDDPAHRAAALEVTLLVANAALADTHVYHRRH